MSAQESAWMVEDVSAQADAEVEALLAAERRKDLLRFSTAGSVDDGKSTLIGRLLYDSHNVYDDHVASVTRGAAIDFAQLTDGLRAEREQGITIDVAYRFFSTARRKFIIADTPGHEEYTRNMATGSSTADVAVVLVDARKGILEQTRRHACIAALLGIPQVIAAVNKMDLVDFSEQVFVEHRESLLALGEALELPELTAVPVSALDGDNVVHLSARMPWYRGPSLLELLETLPPAVERARTGFRMAVQRVIRPHQEFRGFAGQIASGRVRPGDAVVALPSGVRNRVRSITTWDGELSEAHAPQSVVLRLEEEADISRGDILAAAEAPPARTRRVKATVVWMRARPLHAGSAWLLKHTTQTVRARVTAIRSRLDVERLASHPADSLELNAIGEVTVETDRPLLADLYRDNRTTGSFILIDPADSATAGAGMIRQAETGGVQGVESRGALIVLGKRLDGRAALAQELEERLLARGALAVRTRIADRGALRPLVLAGAVVIVETDEANEEAILVVDESKHAEPARVANVEAVLAWLENSADGGRTA
ncbi:MAG TPA: GTP-binding protein [Acidobacteriaceae bacterium]|jgi:sulfate adenylyltransferase subunit 1|nr:GTP-binding protein [Acidobacteriaceae bacterium]